MRLVVRSIGVVVSSLLCAISSPCEGASPSFAELRELITSNHIKTVNAFVGSLPSSYLAEVALVYKSRSLQYADVNLPRIVASTKTVDSGQLAPQGVFLGIAGKDDSDPTPRAGERNVEVIEFDSDVAAFNFYRIEFPEDPSGDVVFSENPEVCSTCHGTPAQPNWDTYGGWPGVYGSLTTNTQLPAEDWEGQNLAALRQRLPSLPRYKGIPISGYESDNDRIGQTINQEVAQSVYQELKGDAQFAPLLPALFDTTKDPVDDFIKLLPGELQQAAAARFPGDMEGVCDSVGRSMASKLYRHLAAGDGHFTRRLFDGWNASMTPLQARFVTLLSLAGRSDMVARLSSELPREIGGSADGEFGLLNRLTTLLGDPANPAITPLYEWDNRFQVADNLATATSVGVISGCGRMTVAVDHLPR